MRTALLIILAISIGGCAMLREHLGFGEPHDETASEPPAYVICDNNSQRLLAKDRDDAELLAVTAVDTASTHSYWQGLFNASPYATTVALTPGPHQLQIRYQDAIFYGSGELVLDAEAGKTYKLQKRVLGLSVQFWLENAQGQRVGNIGNGELHDAGKT